MSKEADTLLQRSGYTPLYHFSKERIDAIVSALCDAGNLAGKADPDKARRIAIAALSELVGVRVEELTGEAII